MSQIVGALRVVLGLNTANYESGWRRAQGSTSRNVSQMQRSIQGMQATMGRAFAAMGVSMGAGLFVNAVRSSLEFASSLAETAEQIGLTVEQLQIFQRIAVASGIGVDLMQNGMQRLGRTIGEAREGNRAAIESFRRLGFTDAQIAGWRDTGEAFRDVATAIDGTADSFVKGQLAAEQFGARVGQRMLPMLHEVATGYDAAAERARAMGIITTEQAQQADVLMDRFGEMATILRTRFAIEILRSTANVGDLTSSLVSLLETFGAMDRWTRSVGDGFQYYSDQALLAADSMGSWYTQLMRLTGGFAEIQARVSGGAVGQSLGNIVGRNTRSALSEGAGRRAGAIAGGIAGELYGRPTTLPVTPRPGGHGGRGGGGGKSAADIAAEEARDAQDFATQRRGYQIRLLEAEARRVEGTDAEANIQAQILGLRRDQVKADLDFAAGQDADEQAQAAILLADYDRVAAAEASADAAERLADQARDRQDIADAEFDAAAEALGLEADMATTARERRDAELRLLRLTEQHEMAKARAIAAEGSGASAGDRAAALAFIGAAPGRVAGQEAQARAGTRGPLEEWAAGVPQTAAQWNEAFEGIAAGGLQSIEDGLVSIMDGTKSVSDAFKDMAASILADLQRILIKRLILMAIEAAMGSLGGGGGGIKMEGLSLPKGFAKGGSFRVGGLPGVDKNLAVMRLSRGEMVSVTPAGRGGGGQMQIVPSPYFDVVVDGRVVSTGGPMIATGMVGARVGAQTDMARRHRQAIP